MTNLCPGNRVRYIEPNLPMFRGDKRALTRILNNLLSNAIKFTPDGGEVITRVKMSEDGNHVVTIADTGIGMSKEDIIRVVKPFEQADSSHSHKHEGTGLGLYICCNLIDLHDGEMTIESDLGKGTTVLVSFPPERVVSVA